MLNSVFNNRQKYQNNDLNLSKGALNNKTKQKGIEIGSLNVSSPFKESETKDGED